MVLTLADMQFGVRASGLDVPVLAGVDPHDYAATIERLQKGIAKAVARRAGLGCMYAEGFRRTRYSGIEGLAKDQPIAEDV